jgi:hypothetical protein
MNRLNYGLLLLGLATCAVAMTGCPGGGGEVLDTQYVEGVVTLDGEPVPGATVTFVPVSGGQGVSATGATDPSGVYKLTAVGTGEATAEAGAGTLAGEYYVGVVKTKIETPMTEEEAEEKGVEYVASERSESPEVTHVVPQKYNNPKESGIKVTVKEGKNDIPIELTSE